MRRQRVQMCHQCDAAQTHWPPSAGHRLRATRFLPLRRFPSNLTFHSPFSFNHNVRIGTTKFAELLSGFNKNFVKRFVSWKEVWHCWWPSSQVSTWKCDTLITKVYTSSYSYCLFVENKIHTLSPLKLHISISWIKTISVEDTLTCETDNTPIVAFKFIKGKRNLELIFYVHSVR